MMCSCDIKQKQYKKMVSFPMISGVQFDVGNMDETLTLNSFIFHICWDELVL